MAVVVIAGIGAVTAGLLAILQQQTASLTEAVQMDRGIGVADSYRLALIDGRDSEDSKEDLELLIGDATLSGNGSNSFTAAVNRTDGRWGYRFIYNPNGVSEKGGGVPQELPEGYDKGKCVEACSGHENRGGECKFTGGTGLDLDNGNREGCDGTGNSGNGKGKGKGKGNGNGNSNQPSQPDKVYFKGDWTLDFNPNANIELEELIVTGDLTIVASPGQGQGNNAATLCVTERFDVGGEVNDLDELSDAQGDCKTPSSGLSGDVVWTFQTAD